MELENPPLPSAPPAWAAAMQRFPLNPDDSRSVAVQLIAHSHSFVALLDRNFCYLALSRRWEQANGKTIEQLMGQSVFEIDPRNKERYGWAFEKALAGEAQCFPKDAYIAQDGRKLWFEWDV